jgi:DedD protein
MDPRAKQRLTGAIILVALFVLLVPELLTGPKSPTTPATPEEEGLRQYTIDLSATNPGATSASAPQVSLPATTPAQTPATPVPVPVPAPAAPTPAPAEDNDASPAVSASPVPTPSPAANPAPSATTPRDVRPPSGSFVVQLGSFGSRQNAERLVRDMTAKGFTTFIAPITTNGRELYRVRVGPTRDRASAEALATQLKRIGQSGSIVPIP